MKHICAALLCAMSLAFAARADELAEKRAAADSLAKVMLPEPTFNKMLEAMTAGIRKAITRDVMMAMQGKVAARMPQLMERIKRDAQPGKPDQK
jgi:hypothetical protein